MNLIWVLAGGVGGLGYVALARRYPPPRELRCYAVGLWVAAGLYVAFAARAGARDLGLETIGLLLYGSQAVVGSRGRPLLLAFGWASHVLWDLAVPRPEPNYVPDWLGPVCLGLDLVIAARIARMAGQRATTL